MDVTAMLNQASAVTKQPRSMIHPRNRMPWDAGGYSLPLVTQSDMSLTKSIHCGSPPVELTDFFAKHKLSDSCSSLSSFTSSTSILHSRFSSTSTVSSFHRFTQAATEDYMQTDPKRYSHSFKPDSSPPISPLCLTNQISPRTKFDTFALTAEYQFHKSPQDEPTRQSKPISLGVIKATSAFDSTAMSDMVQWRRPASPSDKMLMRRLATPPPSSEPAVTESFERRRPVEPQTYLDAPERYPQSLSPHPRGHKRAASAPDAHQLGSNLPEDESKRMITRSPTVELTQLPSDYPDRPSPVDSMVSVVPNTPSEATQAPPPDGARLAPCLYMSNCDTNAPRRKAVSHIFGRNKMCTRLIPKRIWVYYCRKHYQRARYRNGKMWAKLQVELVSEQIKRLEEWGRESQRAGNGGIVKDYTLAMRKREQMRLEEVGDSDRKMSRPEDVDVESGDESAGAQDNSCPATAVPKWLRELSGLHFNASKILEIVDRISDELVQGELPLFPDIEILPNIVVNDREESKPRGHAKRKSSLTDQKRSQSLGAALSHDDPQGGRRISESSAQSSSSCSQGRLPQKRKRLADAVDACPPRIQKMRLAGPLVESEGHGQYLGGRSLCPDINEHRGDREESGSRRFQSDSTHYVPRSQVPSLAAAAPQGRSESSTLANLNSNLLVSDERYPDQVRRFHRRSHSDAGNSNMIRTFANAPARNSVSGSQYGSASLARRSPSPVLEARLGRTHPGHMRDMNMRMGFYRLNEEQASTYPRPMNHSSTLPFYSRHYDQVQ